MGGESKKVKLEELKREKLICGRNSLLSAGQNQTGISFRLRRDAIVLK